MGLNNAVNGVIGRPPGVCLYFHEGDRTFFYAIISFYAINQSNAQGNI